MSSNITVRPVRKTPKPFKVPLLRRPCPQRKKIFKSESPDEAQAPAAPSVQVAEQPPVKVPAQLPSQIAQQPTAEISLQPPVQIAQKSPAEMVPQTAEQSPLQVAHQSPAKIAQKSEIAQRPRRVNAGIPSPWLMDEEFENSGKRQTGKATKIKTRTTICSPKPRTRQKKR